MPLDEVQQSPLTEDWGLNRIPRWRLKLCLWPRRCFLSNKLIWGKRAYHGINMITGPGDPIFDHYYIERDEFILWQLKGNR